MATATLTSCRCVAAPARASALHSTAPSSSSVSVPLRAFSGLKASQQAAQRGPANASPLPALPARRSSAASAAPRSAAIRASADGTYKVAVLGAAGGIGQPLGLLLKMSPLISELRLYDIANVKGVAADLSHCNTPAQVIGFTGADELPGALQGADLVIIPAGVPRKPGMTRDDLFNINAGIVKALAEAIAVHAPTALVNIISNPVNSTVPIAAEVLKAKGVYNPRKVFGVTTLDVVRANTFVAEAKGLRLIDVDVPVIGGHAGITILPLLSKTQPATQFSPEEIEALTVRIQNAGTEVVEAKAGAGSATLSMAYAAARFAESCMRGLDGDGDVYECAYVDSDLTDLPYFASRVKLGKEGLEALVRSDVEGLTEYESKGLEALKAELKGSIEKGIAFANKAPAIA